MNKDAVTVLAAAVDQKRLISAFRSTCRAFGEQRRGRVAADIIEVLNQAIDNAAWAEAEPVVTAELAKRHAAAQRALDSNGANGSGSVSVNSSVQ